MNIDWMIIRRSVAGGLEDGERAELDRWLAQSPLHRSFYDDVLAHYRGDGVAEMPDRDLQRCKNDFESRLARHMALGAHRRRLRRRWRVAAVLLPLMVAGGLLSTLTERRGGAQTDAIAPGIVKALVYDMNTGTQRVVTEADDAMPMPMPMPERQAPCEIADSSPNTTLRVVVPRGAEYTFRMPDGTVVHLNSSSELICDTDPDASERRVELKGEAFFDVSPDPLKPFTVIAEQVAVRVFGTRFNVNTRSVKYIDTVVEQGSVSVTARGEPEKMLRPGEMGQFDRSTGKVEIHRVNAAHYLSWQSGTYVFENRTIEDILSELSIWYDVDVSFPNPAAGRQRFSGSLPRDRELQQLLQLMAKTTRVRFEIEGRTVVVR
jgi:ferric-dicitrate binding protein FerR (iron transport regulator)